MKRAITSLKSASAELLKEIGLIYPKGIDDDHLMSFPTVSGKNIRAIEVTLGDTIYLVKLDKDEISAPIKDVEPELEEEDEMPEEVDGEEEEEDLDD